MGRTSDAKEKLINSARTLIHQGSYASVTVEDICAHADVRRGSLHYFFRTKQALALAAVEENWKLAQNMMLEKVFNTDVPHSQRVTNFLEAAYQLQSKLQAEMGSMPGCEIGSLVCEISTYDEILRERLYQVFERTAAYISKSVEAGVQDGDLPLETDIESTAKAILAYLEGLLVLGKAANDPGIISRLAPAAQHIIILKTSQ